jgi:hypothetical protein
MVGLVAITFADGAASFLDPPKSAMVEATSFMDELAVTVTDTCQTENPPLPTPLCRTVLPFG